MTDRELLEAAAKAAGMMFSVEPQHSDYGRSDWGDEVPHANGEPWNPLTDDGDALRLAVKLRIDINFNCDQVHALGLGRFAHEEFLSAHEFPVATRRAIVRAAAKVNS